MSIFEDASPGLDGVAVNIGDGNVKKRHLRIPTGEYSTPFWIRPDGDNGRMQEVTSLPWEGVIVAGVVEILSSVTPGTPTGVNVNPGDGFIQPSWDDVEENESGYDVHVSTVSGFTPSSSTLEYQAGPDETQTPQLSKTNGTTYYVKVVSKNSSETSMSAEASGTPEAASGIGTWKGNAPGYSTAPLAVDDFDDLNEDWGDEDYTLVNPSSEPSVDGHGADGAARVDFGGVTDGFGAGSFAACCYGDLGITELYWAYTFFLESGFDTNENQLKHTNGLHSGDHNGNWFLGWVPTDGTKTGPIYPNFVWQEPVRTENEPSTPSDHLISRGEWHQFEIRLVWRDGSYDIDVWLDGVLAISADNRDIGSMSPSNSPLVELKFTNVYGGGGTDAPSDAGYLDVGHAYTEAQ